MGERVKAWIPDATAVRDFRTSPEKFRLRHRQHLRLPGRHAPTDGGRAFHAALNAWFGREASDVEAAVAALRVAWGDVAAFDPRADQLALYERALRAYAARWPRETDGFTVEATEQYVEGRIARAGVAFDWCGILDRRIRFADRMRAIMDTKTTSGWFHTAKTEGFFTQHETSEAMLGYLALEQALDRDTVVYYIDAVHIEDGGTCKPERDFQRWRCPGIVAGWRLDRWARDIAWTLGQIAALDAERGPDEPWPVYTNWGWNKPDEYQALVMAAPELAAGEMAAFERRAWVPREVANDHA
jgi:hypothetical protein